MPQYLKKKMSYPIFIDTHQTILLLVKIAITLYFFLYPSLGSYASTFGDAFI